jgi:hypothetical protein
MRSIRHLVLLISLMASPASAAPILSLQPSATTVAEGASVSLDVAISGVDDLYAFEFDLGFDPAFLSATGITEGSFLAAAGSTFFIPGMIDNPGGTVTFTAASLLAAIPGVSGSGTLATVNFTALAPGGSPVNLFNVVLLDSTLSGITGTTSLNGSVTVAGVTAATVPEPATLALVGTGLLLATRRRRHSRHYFRSPSRPRTENSTVPQ